MIELSQHVKQCGSNKFWAKWTLICDFYYVTDHELLGFRPRTGPGFAPVPHWGFPSPKPSLYVESKKVLNVSWTMISGHMPQKLNQVIEVVNYGPGDQCSRIRIFRFFQISKNHDFYVFLKWLWKKRKKSVAKILFSMMLILLQKRKKFVECL